MTCLRTNQRSSFDVLGSGGNQMGAQICTLHGISANSVFASAHSLMALKTLVSKTTALSVDSYFLTMRHLCLHVWAAQSSQTESLTRPQFLGATFLWPFND